MFKFKLESYLPYNAIRMQMCISFPFCKKKRGGCAGSVREIDHLFICKTGETIERQIIYR